MKKLALGLLIATLIIVGCASEANVASTNVSRAADQFEINRRIVFYNGITEQYILVIEGLCSLGNFDSAGELSVTCKVGHPSAIPPMIHRSSVPATSMLLLPITTDM